MKRFSLFSVVILASACGDGAGNSAQKKQSLTDQTKNRQEQLSAPHNAAQQEENDLVIVKSTPVRVEFLHASEIRAAIAGTIEQSAKEGTAFKKSDVLIQFDNRAAFEKLISEKERFMQFFKGFSEKSGNPAWTKFGLELSPYKLLPALPDIQNPDSEEQQLIAHYSQLRTMESEMKNYFVLAEKDGIVLSQAKAPGEAVGKGELVLVTGKNKRKGFRMPEHIIADHNLMLTSRKTGDTYFVDTDGSKKLVEVSSEIPAGDYFLMSSQR